MISNYHIVIILQYEHLISVNDQKFTLLHVRKSVINKFDKVQQNMGKEDELLNLVTCNDNG